MTDHELAVKMVKQGLNVFDDISREMPATNFAIVTAPVLVMACINASIQVHMMKQLAAALSKSEVKLDINTVGRGNS